MLFLIGFRLMVYGGVIAYVFENRRCDLPAQVTVDAGVIDEEVTLDVFGIRTVGIGHTLILKQCINLRDATPVTFFSQLARQPYPDDIPHLLFRDHFTAESQDVRSIV